VSKPPPSHHAILEAAAAEFADRGYEGTRMEHVAKRAGFNKALVYRHFGDKDGLFRAVLRHRFTYREQILDRLPESLGDLLVFWTRQQRTDPHFMRLIQREALKYDGSEPVESEGRHAYYQRQVGMVRALQEAGQLDPELDPEMLFVALTSVVVFPDSFPQIVRLMTGVTHDSPEFDVRWATFLQNLAEKLR
jgi:AcrR family transcriptional regulator